MYLIRLSDETQTIDMDLDSVGCIRHMPENTEVFLRGTQPICIERESLRAQFDLMWGLYSKHRIITCPKSK